MLGTVLLAASCLGVIHRDDAGRLDVPPVIIDFSKTPVQKGDHVISYEVKFEGGNIYRYAPDEPLDDIRDAVEMLKGNMRAAGVECEVREKKKVVITCWKRDGKVFKVQEGKITSDKIKPEDLPSVKNPPKA